METVIVIPARWQSTRFPGKPLANIANKPMLKRVWDIASAANGADKVLIATDDERIQQSASEFGAEVVMTSSCCSTGTERAFEAVSSLADKPRFVINLQGDAVLTPPWIISSLIESLKSNSNWDIATPYVLIDAERVAEISDRRKKGNTTGTFVVLDNKGCALYFSKQVIPFIRENTNGSFSHKLHIGLYAYRYRKLEEFCSLETSSLEKAEKLEQLRALENGMTIGGVLTDYRGRTHFSVDSPEDVMKVEQIIEAEGELVT